MKRRLIDMDEAEEVENTLPLINIVFLLLIFFMIAGVIEKSDLFDVNPPKSQVLTEKNDTAVKISMSKDDRFALEGVEYSMKELVAQLNGIADKNRPVEIKADAALDTHKLLLFLRELKKQKFKQATLLVSSKP